MIMMLVILISWLSDADNADHDADHDVITCCWSKQNLNKWTRGFVHHSPCVCCQRSWLCDHNIKHHNHHFHCIQCKQIPRLSFFGGQCCLFTNAVMSWPSSPDRKVGPRLTVTLANLKKKRLLSPKVGPPKIHYQIIKRPNPTHCGLSFSILATFGFGLDYDDMKKKLWWC